MLLQSLGGIASIASFLDLAVTAPQAVPPSPRFAWLPLGRIMPTGWIKAQLQMDLREGFAGKLDRLAPPEVDTDIFDRGRNRPGSSNIPTADSPGAQPWWNGESEGNWRTGFIMMAFLADDDEAKAQAGDYVRHILDTQGADGYIGVYSPEFRASQNVAHGDLWTQACILRGLLSYYELTGQPTVLASVERAVQCTMRSYGRGGKPPFPSHGEDSGTAHGLMFTDVLERLYALTGDARYRDFGLWLYQEFCAAKIANYQDTTLASLLDRNRPFRDHGAHTFECMRAPLWGYFVSGRDDLGRAYQNAFRKLDPCLFPSGAAVSMEDIGAREPDPTDAYYEYCAMKELLATFGSALQKTGNAEFGDRIERLILNAAQGARKAGGKGITYLTRDNRPEVSGALDGRDKFSPAHADVAVCCAPNATQAMPLYVRGMWMQAIREHGLAATLYGPCRVNTTLRGTDVRVEEQTHWPFSPEVLITLSPQQPVEFPLLLRDPAWSGNTEVTCPDADVRRDGNYFVVCKTWRKGDQVTIKFHESISGIRASNGETAIQRGPLVYALAVPAVERRIKTYSLPGFADTEYFPSPGSSWAYALPSSRSQGDFGFTAHFNDDANRRFPFETSPVRLEGSLIEVKTGQPRRCELVPMGCSEARLRRVTFPVS
jgi:hypothetical protein